MKTDKLKLKLLAIMLVVAVGVSVSSCDDEEYYFSDLVGSWQLVESGGQPVYDYQVDYLRSIPTERAVTLTTTGAAICGMSLSCGTSVRAAGCICRTKIRNTATRCVIIAMTDAICISPRVRRSTTTRGMPRRAEDFRRRGQ